MPDQPDQPSDCLFCRPDDPAVNTVLCRSPRFYARLDNFPAHRGHFEIIPYEHVLSYWDLPEDAVAEAHALARRAKRIVLRDIPPPDGWTIGINDGPAAGQSIPHLHIHYVPRYWGDVPDPRGGIRRCLPNGNPDTWRVPA